VVAELVVALPSRCSLVTAVAALLVAASLVVAELVVAELVVALPSRCSLVVTRSFSRTSSLSSFLSPS
jgi:hypothetical protein